MWSANGGVILFGWILGLPTANQVFLAPHAHQRFGQHCDYLLRDPYVTRSTFHVALAGMLASIPTVDLPAAIITFDGFAGTERQLVTTAYTEGNFAVTPITGRWFAGHGINTLGNPIPAINGDTNTATLEITNLTTSLLTFTSIDMSSGTLNKPVEYTLEGMLAGITVFSATGIVSYPFVTINSPSASPIDTLRLSIVRLEAEGYGLDNIRLNEPLAAVPESASALSWALLGLVAACCRWAKVRQIVDVRQSRRQGASSRKDSQCENLAVI